MTPARSPPGCPSRSRYRQRPPRRWLTGLVTGPLAITQATNHFDRGTLLADLTRQIAFRTESLRAGPRLDLRAYLEQETVPAAHRLPS
jgi:hypothetical protein